MIFVYIWKLDLKIDFINIKVQKIDSFSFKIFEMILTRFYIKNKLERVLFF